MGSPSTHLVVFLLYIISGYVPCGLLGITIKSLEEWVHDWIYSYFQVDKLDRYDRRDKDISLCCVNRGSFVCCRLLTGKICIFSNYFFSYSVGVWNEVVSVGTFATFGAVSFIEEFTSLSFKIACTKIVASESSFQSFLSFADSLFLARFLVYFLIIFLVVFLLFWGFFELILVLVWTHSIYICKWSILWICCSNMIKMIGN